MASPAVVDDRTTTAQPLVRLAGVQKTFDGETLVVKNLNLDIARGEFVTLLGPSGSGKTTTLNLIAGFEAPTHGDIVMAGRSLSRVPPHKRDIGMVFQNYALFPHMTVAENVAFPLEVRRARRSEMRDKVERALAMVRLSGYGGRRPTQLSGGQQQRVALARALVFDPTLVLMDEPLGALDKQLREQMQIEIRHLHERLGVTVVYVTHDQAEALTLSNRIAVLNDGAIQQVATPEELYEAPQNAFVAQFIGENNRFSGTVVARNGAYCTVEVPGRGHVEALSVSVGAVGAEATLSLRPERVVVEPPEDFQPNVFEARVEELIYLGDHTRTRVSVLGRDDFVVKIPNTKARRGLAPGARVRVGWNAEDCRALDTT